MNYWVAEVCNLSELHEPLLRMVGELQAPGSKHGTGSLPGRRLVDASQHRYLARHGAG